MCVCVCTRHTHISLYRTDCVGSQCWLCQVPTKRMDQINLDSAESIIHTCQRCHINYSKWLEGLSIKQSVAQDQTTLGIGVIDLLRRKQISLSQLLSQLTWTKMSVEHYYDYLSTMCIVHPCKIFQQNRWIINRLVNNAVDEACQI